MRKMLDPKTIALIGATEAEGTVGRTIMENLMRSRDGRSSPSTRAHKSVFDIACFPNIGAVPERVDLAVVATPAHTVPDVLLECAKAGVQRGHRRLGGLRRDRQGRPRARETHQEDPAGLPDARRGAQLPRHHPPERGSERVVPARRAQARRHRADLAERSSGHRDAGLGRERPRGVLAVRLGRQHGRRRLRRPRRLPRRGPAHAEHPHLHGDDRERSALHERSAQLRAQQADHRPEARPLLGERARGAVAHRRDDRRRRGLRGRLQARRRAARATRSPTCSTPPRCSTRVALPVGPGVAIVTNAGGPGRHGRPTRSSSTADAWPSCPRRRWGAGRGAALRTGATANPDRRPRRRDQRPVRRGGQGVPCRPRASTAVILLYTPQGNARPDEMAEQVAGAGQGLPEAGDHRAHGRRDVSTPDARSSSRPAVPCYDTPEEAVRTYMSMYQYARNLELLYETPAELPIDIAPPKHNLQAMLRRVAAQRPHRADRGGVQAVRDDVRLPRDTADHRRRRGGGARRGAARSAIRSC